MKFRAIVPVALLAIGSAGCTINTVAPQSGPRVAPAPYPYKASREMYEGYYYARIIYINDVPYHVHDDRRAYLLPHHLHAHFRSAHATQQRPFGWPQEPGVRDGYHLARIVYVDNVPYHVEDDRRARPLPPATRPRFSYSAPRGSSHDEPPKADATPPDERGRGPAGGHPAPATPPAYGLHKERDLPPGLSRQEEPKSSNSNSQRDGQHPAFPAAVRAKEHEPQNASTAPGKGAEKRLEREVSRAEPSRPNGEKQPLPGTANQRDQMRPQSAAAPVKDRGRPVPAPESQKSQQHQPETARTAPPATGKGPAAQVVRKDNGEKEKQAAKGPRQDKKDEKDTDDEDEEGSNNNSRNGRSR